MKQKLSQMNEMLQLEKKSSDLYLEKSQQLEIANRTLEEENNTLKANYTHIQKRYDKLQHELSEAKKNTKS
jgi:chaperonin cofactor prefoldin